MVRQALVTLGSETTFGKPKTKGSARSIPIPPSLVNDLREHRRSQLEAMLFGT